MTAFVQQEHKDAAENDHWEGQYQGLCIPRGGMM